MAALGLVSVLMETGSKIFIVMAVLLGATLASAAFGCGDGDPAEAVERFIYATVDQDCPAMVDMLADSSIRALGATREEAVSNCQRQLQEATSGELKTEVTRFEVTGVKLDGDEATVNFSMAVRIVGQTDSVPRDDYLRVRKENGQWKVVTD